MTIIAWVVLGLASGFIASRLMTKSGGGLGLGLFLGICGACVGGYVSTLLGSGGVVGLNNVWSLFAAMLGAMSVLLAYHSFMGSRGK